MTRTTRILSRIEAAVAEQGKIRLLALFRDFHGWDLLALWDDIKFSTKRCFDVERIALVGDKACEKWMAKVCKPFTNGQSPLLQCNGDRGSVEVARRNMRMIVIDAART